MLLVVKNLTKQYGRDNALFNAVNNVSFTMAAGEFVTIMGRSGSGKTTLLNLLAGLLTPTKGYVSIDNTALFELGDRQIAAFRNQYIGYIPQGSSLLANLTGLDNIRLPLYLSGNAVIDSQSRALELMERAGISYLQQTYPAAMSGGEMRRIAIVRALMCAPKIIIADEPTSDLDKTTATEIMQLFSQLNQQGSTLLIVTHDESVAQYSQRKLIMQAGQLSD